MIGMRRREFITLLGGCGVAARCARAAAGDIGDRLPRHAIAGRIH